MPWADWLYVITASVSLVAVIAAVMVFSNRPEP
jgi:hypothetical protein